MVISQRPYFLVFFVALLSATSVLRPEVLLAQQTKPLPNHVILEFGQPPAVPVGDLTSELKNAVGTVFVDSLEQSSWGRDQTIALDQIARSKDPRLAWIISDMMRFTWRQAFDDALAKAASGLLGIEFKTPQRWHEITDHLIAWDIPSYPGYLETKRSIFTQFVPGWEPIFIEGEIDWRLVSWGGVNIDDRAYDQTDKRCNCIPAADNPKVSSAEDATWLKDDEIVFGIEVNGEFRAYPRRIMEVREMVNDTLGDVTLAFPIAHYAALLRPILPTNCQRE